MRKKGVCCVDQSIEELKQRLFAATRRMHKSRSHPPLPEGITPTEGFVLMSISQLMSDGKRVRSGDIAKRGHSTPSATSQALKSLEEKGFITRHRDEGDSRGVTVQLTAYVEEPCDLKGDSVRKTPSKEAFAGNDSKEGGEQCE